MKHREWRVFYFEFAASGKKHNIAVASTGREEARALVLASFKGAAGLRERAKKARGAR
jgi:hypothetical protein